jgi:hypothetical protein
MTAKQIARRRLLDQISAEPIPEGLTQEQADTYRSCRIGGAYTCLASGHHPHAYLAPVVCPRCNKPEQRCSVRDHRYGDKGNEQLCLECFIRYDTWQ